MTLFTQQEKEKIELDRYREYVGTIAKEADGKKTVLNRTPQHAGIVISTIFQVAHNTVEILTGVLQNAVFGTPEVIKAAEEFLRRNPSAKISILSETEISTDRSTFLCAMRDRNLASRIKIETVPLAIQSQYTDRFIVADALHYRYQVDRTKFDASVQFGNEENGRELHLRFQELLAKIK